MRILGSSRPISPQRAMFLCGIAAGACHQVTLLRDPLDSSLYDAMCYPSCGVGLLSRDNKKAVLSHGEQRDAAANFERPTYRILKWHSAVSLPEHGFRSCDHLNAEITHTMPIFTALTPLSQ